jgi:hypothetical protein
MAIRINRVLFNIFFFGYPHDRAWCLLHGTKDATFLLTICPFSYCYQPGIFSMLNESYLRVSHE